MSDGVGARSAPAGLVEATFSPEQYREFVGTLELTRVEAMHLLASRTGHGAMARTDAAVESSVAVDPEQSAIFYKYDLNAHVFDDGGNEVGQIDVTLVLVFTTPVTSADQEMVQHFGGTAAFMMAFPYLREAVGTLAARIGLPGVVLPLIRP